MMINRSKLTIFLLTALLLNSCSGVNSSEEKYFNKIREDLRDYENALILAKGQYQSTIEYENKVSVAFHPDSLGWDSLTNVKLLKLQQDLKTVVSTHSESVYQLEKILSEAKRNYVNSTEKALISEKHLRLSWEEQRSEINNSIYQTKIAHQAVDDWKKGFSTSRSITLN